MTHLLDPQANDRLVEFAQGKSVAVFDFDGTLAPIVANRDLARMRRRTLVLLTRLCGLYPCGVVSGRGRLDVIEHLEGAPVPVVFGSHGIEPGPDLERFEHLIGQVRAELDRHLAGTTAVEIEDKRYSLAIHYRRASDRAIAHLRLLAILGQLKAPIRLVEGICVVNVVPMDAPHKGDAVRAIQRHFDAEQVLYVGDDVTDEDVFRYTKSPAWLSVRVERASDSAASYFLCRQREMDVLLSRLIRMRRP